MAELVSTHVPRPADNPQLNVVRFSDKAREGLELAGYQVYELTGKSIGEMATGDGHPVRVTLLDTEPVQALRSRKIEVALRPTPPLGAAQWNEDYVPTLDAPVTSATQALLMRERHKLLTRGTRAGRDSFDEVDPWIVGPADYTDLAVHVGGLETFLFGHNGLNALMTTFVTQPSRELEAGTFSFLPGPSAKETVPARVAAVNLYDGKVAVTDYPTNYRGGDMSPGVRPLIVPRGAIPAQLLAA